MWGYILVSDKESKVYIKVLELLRWRRKCEISYLSIGNILYGIGIYFELGKIKWLVEKWMFIFKIIMDKWIRYYNANGNEVSKLLGVLFGLYLILSDFYLCLHEKINKKLSYWCLIIINVIGRGIIVNNVF